MTTLIVQNPSILRFVLQGQSHPGSWEDAVTIKNALGTGPNLPKTW